MLSPILASIWMAPFALSRAEKGRNPMHLQRALYMLMGLGSHVKMGVRVAFCQPHNGGHPVPPRRLSPPRKSLLCLPANRHMSSQTPTSRETCLALLPLISSTLGGPLLFCPRKLSSPCLAYSHCSSSLPAPPTQALPSTQQGGHACSGVGASRDNI